MLLAVRIREPSWFNAVTHGYINCWKYGIVWVFRCKYDIYTTPSKGQGTSCKSVERRTGRYGGDMRNVIWARQKYSLVNNELTVTVNTCTVSAQEQAHQQWVGAGSLVASLTAELFVSGRFSEKGNPCLQLVPTDDPSTLQWIVSIQCSHRWSWLTLMGHKEKPKVMDLGKLLVGREEQGRQERMGSRIIKMHCTHTNLSSYNIFKSGRWNYKMH